LKGGTIYATPSSRKEVTPKKPSEKHSGGGEKESYAIRTSSCWERVSSQEEGSYTFLGDIGKSRNFLVSISAKGREVASSTVE